MSITSAILRLLRVGWLAALVALVCSPAVAQGDNDALCPDTPGGNPTPDFLVQWQAQYGPAVFGGQSPELNPKFQQQQISQFQVDPLALLLQLNDAIQTADQITCVRRWRQDDQLVDYLITQAAGTDSRYRVPATLVLENIVDNTNVCRVIATLANGGSKLDDNARYDLLLVLAQVAHYAYSDTGEWIGKVVADTSGLLGADPSYEKTAQLLGAIQKTLDTRPSSLGYAYLTGKSISEYRNCAALLPPDFKRDPHALQPQT